MPNHYTQSLPKGRLNLFSEGDKMHGKKSFKYIGILKPEIAKYWSLDEHANKPIVIYNDRKQHIIDRHLKDFGSIEKIDECWNKLSKIINKPDNVFYNEKTKGLEYYKKIDEEIVVAVRINFSKVLKIRSFYPANKGKLKNRKKKERKMDKNLENVLL